MTCIFSPLIAGAGTSCQSCPAGTFSSRNASSSCTICTGDQPYSQPDRAACSSFCPLGFEVSLLDKNCVPCSAGKFSGDYLTACLTCQAGTYSASVNGSTACVSFCAPGTHSVESNVCPSKEKCGGFCTKCDSGTYSVGGKAACTFCSAGANSLSGATACTACAPARLGVCSYCEAGLFPKLRGSDFLTCAACDMGKYFSTYGSTYCAALTVLMASFLTLPMQPCARTVDPSVRGRVSSRAKHAWLIKILYVSSFSRTFHFDPSLLCCFRQ